MAGTGSVTQLETWIQLATTSIEVGKLADVTISMLENERDVAIAERNEARQVARQLLRVVKAYEAWPFEGYGDLMPAKSALSPALRRLVEE